MSRPPMYQADFNYFSPAMMMSQPVTQAVRNGREFDNPGWETTGFDLKTHHSAVTDWSDDEEIKRVHYPEISRLAKELTGCDYALVGGHISRNPAQAQLHTDLAPIQFVHSDFAESYGDLIRRFYTEDSEAISGIAEAGASSDDVINASRLLIIQFWRNVGPATMDLPIAFCDARSVSADEVIAAPVQNYAGGGFDFETLAVTAADDGHHDWYSYPEMQIDDVVVFRTYDTARIGTDQPYWTPHSAFRDPNVKIGQPSRHSIELRATCLFS